MVAHRTARQPRISVLLAVHDAADFAVRTIESVLAQDMRDLELVVADCASADRTPRVLAHAAEHDIRVETLSLDAPDVFRGYAAALARARGSHILFMAPGDWLAPGYLVSMLDAADGAGAQLAISALSLDSERDDGGRSSISISPASQTWETPEAFRRGVGSLLADDVLSRLTGKVAPTAELRYLGTSAALSSGDAFDFALSYLSEVKSACVLQGAVYHALRPAPATVPFDPGMYERCERHHERLLALYRSWGLAGDADCMEAVHRFHLTQIIRCIENACLSSGRLSSIERRQRVQDMIDAPSTRASIDALRSSSRDFGLMFAPIARRSAAACCMGARIQDIVERTLAPFAPVRTA